MTVGVRNTFIGIAAIIAFALGLLLFSLVSPSQMTEQQALALGYYRFAEPKPLSAFSLVDHADKPANLDALRGQWSLLFFGFTHCPHICPTTLQVLNNAVQKLKDAPQIVLVSVDPERDTPERLRHYLSAFNPDFRGFSGTFEETVNLARQVNIAFGKMPGNTPGTYTVDHSVSLVIIDPEARYVGFIKAPHQAEKIEQVIRSF